MRVGSIRKHCSSLGPEFQDHQTAEYSLIVKHNMFVLSALSPGRTKLNMWLYTPPPNILEGIVIDFIFNVFLLPNRMSGKFVIFGCKKTRK